MKLNAKLREREWASKLERDYSLVLKAQQQAAEIAWWAYEPISFRIGAGASYCPDFVVLRANGELEAHECKGFRREAAIVRIKVAARMVPWCRFVLVTRDRRGWHLEEIKR